MFSSFQPQQVGALATATASAVESAYATLAGHGAKQTDADVEVDEEPHQNLAASRAAAAVAAIRAQSLGNQLAERVAVARTDLDDALLSSTTSSSSSGGAAASAAAAYQGVQLISQRASTFLQQVKTSGLELLGAGSLDAEEEQVGDGIPRMYSLQEAASASVQLCHRLWELWREKHAALSASENLYMALLADSRRTSALVAELEAVQAMLQSEQKQTSPPSDAGLSEVMSPNSSTTSVAVPTGNSPVFTCETEHLAAASLLKPSEADVHESGKYVSECSQNAQEGSYDSLGSNQDALQSTQAASETIHKGADEGSHSPAVLTDHQHTLKKNQDDEKQDALQHRHSAEGGGSHDTPDSRQDVLHNIGAAAEVSQGAKHGKQSVPEGFQDAPAKERTEGMHEQGYASQTKEGTLMTTFGQPDAAKPQLGTDESASVSVSRRVSLCSAYDEPQATRSRSARTSRAAKHGGRKLDVSAECSSRGFRADLSSARQEALRSVTATIEAQATEAVDSFRERAKHYPCGWSSHVTGFLQISRSDEQLQGVLEAFQSRVAQEQKELLTQVIELAVAPDLRTLTASLSRRVAFWEAEIEENWAQWSKQSGHFHEACAGAAECWTQLREIAHNLLAWTEEFVHAAPLGEATPPMLHMVPLLDSEGARHYRRWEELHDAHVEVATVLSLLGGWADFHNLRGDGHVLTEARDLLHAVVKCLDVQFSPFRFQGRNAVCTKLAGNHHWRLVAAFEAAGPDKGQPAAWPWWSPRGWPSRPGLSPSAFAPPGPGNGSVHVV